MDETAETHGEPSRSHTHRGYSIEAVAVRTTTGDWTSHVTVRRNGIAIDLQAPPEIGPNWSTHEEALRAAVERAVYLVDRRDNLPSLGNPAR